MQQLADVDSTCTDICSLAKRYVERFDPWNKTIEGIGIDDSGQVK